MSVWKLITESIGRTGALVMIAIAGTFYVSFTFYFHVSEFKTDINSQIAAMDAKFEAEFDAMDAKFEARFDAMDARFDAMDARFDAMDARFDEQNELLLRMIQRMDERLLNVELMALVNRKNDVLAMPQSEERTKLVSQLDKEIRHIEQLKLDRKYDLSETTRQ